MSCTVTPSMATCEAAVEHDSLLGVRHGETLEVPVVCALQPESVAGLAGGAVGVTGIEQRVVQHGFRAAGQRDRRGRGSRCGGDELVAVVAVGEGDRVARLAAASAALSCAELVTLIVVLAGRAANCATSASAAIVLIT